MTALTLTYAAAKPIAPMQIAQNMSENLKAATRKVLKALGAARDAEQMRAVIYGLKAGLSEEPRRALKALLGRQLRALEA